MTAWSLPWHGDRRVVFGAVHGFLPTAVSMNGSAAGKARARALQVKDVGEIFRDDGAGQHKSTSSELDVPVRGGKPPPPPRWKTPRG